MFKSVVPLALVVAVLAGNLSAQDRTVSQSTTLPAAAARPPNSQAIQQIRSANNLKRLGLAVHNYHDSYQRIPAAFSTDQDAKPLLSWRVHLLPFLNEQALYEQFRLDEPWNSEHNKKLIAKMPKTFYSGVGKQDDGETTYLGVSGPKGIISGRDSISFRDITDGTSPTLMFVEVDSESTVTWTEPVDFVPDAKTPSKGLSGQWNDGFHGCFGDGAVRLLKKDTDPDTLRAMFTYNGGERFDMPGVSTTLSIRLPAIPMTPSTRAVPLEVVPVEPAMQELAAEVKKLGGKRVASGYKSSWSPDASQLVFGIAIPGSSRDDSGGLGILDVETGEVKKLLAPGKDPDWQPGDGDLIAYVTGYGNTEELWVVAPTGGEPRKLAKGGYPTWAPDGRTLFYHSHSNGKLMSVRVDTEDPEPKELMSMIWWYPAISADGKKVAYRSGSQILVADIESGKLLKTLQFPDRGRGFLGGWSADGKRIGFGGYGGSDAVGLWIVDVESGTAKRLALRQFTMLAWSRDGSKVALDHRLGADKEIWTMDAKALGEVRLEESLIDRYAIPEGGVSELVKFIEELKQFRPATARERSEYAQKYQETLNEAAKRILVQEEDRWSEAYQTALRIRLLLRISRFGQRDLKQQEQTVDFVKRFLKAKLDREMETADVELAMFIARALESTGSRGLAARAYNEFAELVAESGDDEFAARVKQMQESAKRLEGADD